MRQQICIGGSIAAYSDEWWKGKYSTDPGCPDNDPAVQGVCGYSTSSHPDGYSNEEWRGIMRTLDNGSAPDIMEPRAVYYMLRALWTSPINVVWQDDTKGNNEIFLKKSIDGGDTWAFRRLSLNAGVSVRPGISR